MRTRSRNEVKSSWPAYPAISTVYTNVKCDGTSESASYTSAPQPLVVNHEVAERMRDSVGRGTVHGVVHRKSERRFEKLTSWPALPEPYGTANYGSAHESVMSYYSNVLASAYIRGIDIESDVFAPSGWTLGVPDVNERNVVNDLKEKARQLKADVILDIVEGNQIWPAIKSAATFLPFLKQHMGSAARLAKHTSNAFLAWKFGLAPLISDLSQIAKFAPDMQRQYNKFKESGLRRFSKVFTLNPQLTRSGTKYSLSNGVVWFEYSYQGISDIAERRYVLVVKPNAPAYLTDTFGKLDFLLRRFSTSPARLAWELVPFSFVADWFVDLRDALDGLDKLVGVEPYQVISLTRSTKIHLDDQVFVSLRSGCGDTLFDGRFGGITEEFYERSALSDVPKLATQRRFGKSQAGITAALIGQRLKRL